MVVRLEKQLRTLAEHLPFDVWVRDRHDRCLYANAAALRRWPSLLGRTIEENDVSPEVAELWRSNNRRALAGEVVQGDETFERAGETHVVHNIIAPVWADGEVVGTVGVNIDIAPQRRAEAEARERGLLLQSVLDTTRAAVGVRELTEDKDLLHVLDNGVTAGLFGKRPEETRGKTDRELGVAQKDVEPLIERITRDAGGRGVVDFELALPTPKGTRTFVGAMARLETEPGRPLRFFFVADDATEQRVLESQLLRSERLASLGGLAASIAHEIKNPATAALVSLGHLETVLERHEAELPPSLRAELVEGIASAMSGVELVSRLVRDLGVLAKPTDDVLDSVDVDDVVRSAVALTRSALVAQASVTEELGAPPPVRANAIRLAQVLINLLTNAAQAIERSARRGHIAVRTSSVEGRAQIEVSDDGAGLPAQVRDRLFEAFVSSSPSGTGLGLHLSRQIVEAYGGRIEALDRPTGGTTFRVSLPFAAVSATSAG